MSKTTIYCLCDPDLVDGMGIINPSTADIFVDLGCRLTNSTEGGDGLFNPSQKTREKISRNNRGKTGHIFTRETRTKLSVSAKQRMAEPIARSNAAEYAKKLWLNPTFREKFSEFNRKRWADPSYKKKQKDLKKKYWSDPAHRKMQADITRKLSLAPQ